MWVESYHEIDMIVIGKYVMFWRFNLLEHDSILL